MADFPGILDRGGPNRLRKTITFAGGAGTGAVGQVTVVTPTGTVLIKKIVPACTTSLTGGAAPTVSLGTSGLIAGLIAATLALNIDAGQYWLSATPAATLLLLPAGLQNFAIGTPITMDVLVNDITAGVLVFDIEWEAVTLGATLV